ncbi:hypothetical protein BpHYR1_053382 [Brachionus plicatilis]|uniref:Uncharacterized protein n=1 Tax=Brachionus plicatilis TaxID=10195 RepID=A0A3M7P362_BRAPC|nr:hypothetical protein BpHYR1_053382 [Brachionus plicatilis]
MAFWRCFKSSSVKLVTLNDKRASLLSPPLTTQAELDFFTSFLLFLSLFVLTPFFFSLLSGKRLKKSSTI